MDQIGNSNATLIIWYKYFIKQEEEGWVVSDYLDLIIKCKRLMSFQGILRFWMVVFDQDGTERIDFEFKIWSENVHRKIWLHENIQNSKIGEVFYFYIVQIEEVIELQASFSDKRIRL